MSPAILIFTLLASDAPIVLCTTPAVLLSPLPSDKLLIYRLEIWIIERNGSSDAFFTFAIFLTRVVLSCEFLKIAIFRVK